MVRTGRVELPRLAALEPKSKDSPQQTKAKGIFVGFSRFVYTPRRAEPSGFRHRNRHNLTFSEVA